MRTSFGSVSNAAGKQGSPYADRVRNPQVTAWLVLSLSFGIFWLLVVGAFFGGRYYYETSSVPHNATLKIESGIVLFRDAVTSTLINATDNLEVREGDEVLVGQGARASIHLSDGSLVYLYPGADVVLKELRRSRFHDGFGRVEMLLAKGTARFLIAEPTVTDRRFSAATPFGAAELGVGSFGVEVAEESARISSRVGPARVTLNEKKAVLYGGEKAVLAKDDLLGPLPEGDHLVNNGDFAQGFSQWIPMDLNEAGRPEEPGQRSLITERIDGREAIALRISRLSPRGTHNETGLSYIINKDVSDYQSLELRANVKVTGQSLSGGGYMGYEYPIMIRVRYRDATGGQIDWTHGFFASNPEERPTPNGEEVPRGDWITYNGNLMQISPRPIYIISVEVLGAGHTFDGAVANVALVGK